MDRYVFIGQERIPSNRIDDVKELQTFIRRELDIFLTINDVYKLWCQVSEDWDAGWLTIYTHFNGVTREEFLRDQIEKYCRRV